MVFRVQKNVRSGIQPYLRFALLLRREVPQVDLLLVHVHNRAPLVARRVVSERGTSRTKANFDETRPGDSQFTVFWQRSVGANAAGYREPNASRNADATRHVVGRESF
jgi:hypothetical protein